LKNSWNSLPAGKSPFLPTNFIRPQPGRLSANCRTKINVNLGVSPEHNNHEEELQKVQNAIDMKAEAIMDLSNFGKTRDFRRKLVGCLQP
jgi:thiamine biosynthesis protein ThiC